MSKKNILIGLGAFIFIILGIFINNFKSIKPTAIEETGFKNYNNYQIIVDIKGEVKKPGIYYLNNNSRVIDAINIAGGLTSEADIENINLASKIDDGMIINIFKKEIKVNKKISINHAAIEELMKLPGIGEAKAKAIIKHRYINGYFMSLEQIKDVDGINENLFQQIKELISL